MYGDQFVKELEGYEARFPEERKSAALLLALHAVQRERGHVDDEAKAWLAERYDISVADVQGVITFYTMYFDRDPGKHLIWLCRTFSCQLLGAKEVARALEKELGCRMGESSADGEIGIYWMECLAACDRAPCALVDDDMVYDITPESVSALVEHVRGGGAGGVVTSGDDGTPRIEPLPRSTRDTAGGR